MPGLVERVLAIVAGLDLDAACTRIVQTAVDLGGARYGAIGLLGRSGVTDFAYTGLDAETGEAIGHPPRLTGLLGALAGAEDGLRVADVAGHPAFSGFPAHHPPMTTFLGVPVRDTGEVAGILYLAEKKDGEFTPDDEGMLRVLARAASVALENGRRFEHSRARERWLRAAAETSTELLGGAAVAEALRSVADRVRRLAGADGVLILHPDEADPAALVVDAAAGADLRELTGRPMALRHVAIDRVLLRGRPELLDELPGLPGFAGAGPVAVVPLRTTAGPGGLLVVARTRPFSPAEVPMLVSFAGQAAVALEFAAQQRDRRTLGVLADRDRIARDLHDRVIQRLYAAGLGLQGVLVQLEHAPVRAKVAAAVRELDLIQQEIRTSIFDLHSSGADAEDSLRRRLLDVVADLAAGGPVRPVVRISGAVDTLVPPSLHEPAEAVLRAALGVALRRPDAQDVSVGVDAHEYFVIVVAENTTAAAEVVPAVWLAELAERARRFGGTAELVRHGGGGMRVIWRVPLS